MWLSNSAVIKPALIWEPVRVRLPWLRNEPSSFSVDYNKMSINSMPVLEMNKCCKDSSQENLAAIFMLADFTDKLYYGTI